MTRRGVRVCEGERPLRLESHGGAVRLYTDGPEGHRAHEADACVVFATGRAPNTRGMGLEALGVALGARGEIKVDAHHQTSVEGVWAVGDVTDLADLTPVAIKAGRTLADRLYGASAAVMSYDGIPTAVFSEPRWARWGSPRRRRGRSTERTCGCFARARGASVLDGARRRAGADVHEDGGAALHRPGAGAAHGVGPKRAGDHPGLRGGAEGGGDQGDV